MPSPRSLLLTAAVAAAVVVPAPAALGATVSVSGGMLTYSGAPGEVNSLTLDRGASGTTLRLI